MVAVCCDLEQAGGLLGLGFPGCSVGGAGLSGLWFCSSGGWGAGGSREPGKYWEAPSGVASKRYILLLRN